MSSKKQKKPLNRDGYSTSLLELLDAALSEKMETSDSKSFRTLATIYLLEQLWRKDQAVPSLPSHRDVLTELVTNNRMVEAHAWERIAGPAAWQASLPGNNVLHDILWDMIKRANQYQRGGLIQWPRSFKREDAIEFLDRGMMYSMPLKKGHNQTHVEQLIQQCNVLRFCQWNDNLLTYREKLSLFKKHDGELAWIGVDLLDGDKNNWLGLIEADLIQADTKVWLKKNPKDELIGWVEAWQKSEKDHVAVFSHMEKIGMDTTGPKTKYMLNKIKTISKWDQVKALIQETPGGWNYEDEHGRLSWQNILVERPDILSDMLGENKPRLRQKSSKGVGLWDNLLTGLNKKSDKNFSWSKAVSTDDLRDALAKVPMETTRPQLFRKRAGSNWLINELFDLSVEKYPQAWVGPLDEIQAIRASYILQGLLVGQDKSNNAQNREAWAQNASLLYKLYEKQPQALTDDTVAVLWCLGQFMSQYPSKLEWDTSVLAGADIPLPAGAQMNWAKTILEKEKDYKPHSTVNLLLPIVKKLALETIARPAAEERKDGARKPKM